MTPRQEQQWLTERKCICDSPRKQHAYSADCPGCGCWKAYAKMNEKCRCPPV